MQMKSVVNAWSIVGAVIIVAGYVLDGLGIFSTDVYQTIGTALGLKFVFGDVSMSVWLEKIFNKNGTTTNVG